METIVNKIKKSVQSGTGLTCLYGSLDSINVQMGDQTEFPVAFFVLLNNGSLDDRSSNYRERVDVAMFFVKPTEFDFESIENEAIISECKQCAFQWLNSLFLGGDLRYITTLNTSRVYNQMDDILTGYALRVRLEELVGECAPEPFKTTCKVTASANDPTMGTVTGGGEYEIGKPVTLTASFDSNRSIFVSWTVGGTVVSTDPTYTFTATEDVTVVGNFALNYLTLTAEIRGSVKWLGNTYPDIQYSRDGVNWIQFTEPVLLEKDEFIMLKGDNWTQLSDRYVHFDYVVVNGQLTPLFNITGNVMSLVDSSLNTTELTMDRQFACLFSSSCFTSDGNLSLPSTVVTTQCYWSMFQGSRIRVAPELPATTLVIGCYNAMFSNCVALTSAPELPATTLAPYCYQNMFSNCGALTSAPSLPATTLANHCYEYMFRDCTSLETAPELKATTLTGACYSCMFFGCTSLTTAPELPSKTLVSECYYNMFRECTSLTYIKCLAETFGGSGSYSISGWLYDASTTGTFVKAPNVVWPTGTSGIPDGWTVVENTDNG